MQEARCITSHDQPGEKPGRFKRYFAGEVYEVPKLNRYFEPVKAGTLKKLAEEKKAARDKRDADEKKAAQDKRDAVKQAYDKRKKAAGLKDLEAKRAAAKKQAGGDYVNPAADKDEKGGKV